MRALHRLISVLVFAVCTIDAAGQTLSCPMPNCDEARQGTDSCSGAWPDIEIAGTSDADIISWISQVLDAIWPSNSSGQCCQNATCAVDPGLSGNRVEPPQPSFVLNRMTNAFHTYPENYRATVLVRATVRNKNVPQSYHNQGWSLYFPAQCLSMKYHLRFYAMYFINKWFVYQGWEPDMEHFELCSTWWKDTVGDLILNEEYQFSKFLPSSYSRRLAQSYLDGLRDQANAESWLSTVEFMRDMVPFCAAFDCFCQEGFTSPRGWLYLGADIVTLPLRFGPAIVVDIAITSGGDWILTSLGYEDQTRGTWNNQDSNFLDYLNGLGTAYAAPPRIKPLKCGQKVLGVIRQGGADFATAAARTCRNFAQHPVFRDGWPKSGPFVKLLRGGNHLARSVDDGMRFALKLFGPDRIKIYGSLRDLACNELQTLGRAKASEVHLLARNLIDEFTIRGGRAQSGVKVLLETELESFKTQLRAILNSKYGAEAEQILNLAMKGIRPQGFTDGFHFIFRKHGDWYGMASEGVEKFPHINLKTLDGSMDTHIFFADKIQNYDCGNLAQRFIDDRFLFPNPTN